MYGKVDYALLLLAVLIVSCDFLWNDQNFFIFFKLVWSVKLFDKFLSLSEVE